jgi:hypothetical protein
MCEIGEDFLRKRRKRKGSNKSNKELESVQKNDRKIFDSSKDKHLSTNSMKSDAIITTSQWKSNKFKVDQEGNANVSELI